jgi:uncharacterized protein (TIGR02246 family)
MRRRVGAAADADGATARTEDPMTHVERRFIAITLLLGVMLGGAPTAAQESGLRAAVEAANRQFSAALSQGDAAKIASLYSSAAQLFPPNGDIVQGREGIQKAWQGVVDSGVAGATLTTMEVEAGGGVAYEVGRYEMTDKSGKAIDHGKYITIWKNESGAWKIHRDIWNTSVAPAR